MFIVKLRLLGVGRRHYPKKYLLHVLNIDKVGQDVSFLEEPNK